MLRLQPKFDLRRDVVSDVVRRDSSVGKLNEFSGALDTRILNIERDGGILYSWKGPSGTTRMGKYDPNTNQNKLLYTFDQQVCVSSCSLNQEETLLAVSLTQRNTAEERLKPVSQCLTLLIEIHPINHTKVLKAVDCRVKVQFLYPEMNRGSVLESHLLLLVEDGYVDQYHVMLSRHEGYRVVMVNPEHLSRTAERIAEDISWVQWDTDTQRLYYLTQRDKSMLKCVQFYSTRNCETVFELVLEVLCSPSNSVRFVNLGFDHYHKERPEEEPFRMEVFTNGIESSMCVCHSQPLDNMEISYTIVLVHKGYSKTFKVSLDDGPCEPDTPLYPMFIPIGHYILVCLPRHFLHCINSRQQDLLCHSLFLSGSEADLGLPVQTASWVVLQEESSTSLLDLDSGRSYTADLSSAHLLQILQEDTPTSCRHTDTPASRSSTPTTNGGGYKRCDGQRLAALHCLLVYMGHDTQLQLQIIDWLCDSDVTFESFNQIQEFILASLYRIAYEKSLGLDKVLPYSSVFYKKELPQCLQEVPGVSCTLDLHPDPVFRGKARSQGFWAELQWTTEKLRYLEAVPHPRYGPPTVQAEWDALKSEKSATQLRHMEDNAKKVLSMVDTWSLDKKLVPLFQEEDHQQRAHIGLMVDKLREHLNRHLPRLGKKKLDTLVVSYVAKLLELIRHILESVWVKYKLGPRVLCLTQPGSPSEWSVFHVMCRILEAMRGLCLPLPPGYHTLLVVLGVRCLPHQTFLQYIDHGLLQITDTFLSRLMTDLDNSDANEKLKFSILKRLPESMEQRIFQLWDHPVTSACISRNYVKTLLERHNKQKGPVFRSREKPDFTVDFLPLDYMTAILSDLEEQATNPFEEQENVDSKFVEETALKQTFILLGLEDK